MAEKSVYSVCGMCPVRCPIEVLVENGTCRFIQGNPHVEGIRGAICTRGAAAAALVADDERPQFPMLRQGERGQGRWQRLGWDEALDLAAQKLDALRRSDGPASIVWADAGGPFSDFRQALVRGLESPHYYGADALHGANFTHACRSLLGLDPQRLVFDFAHASHVVLQSRNLLENVDVAQANALLDGLARGGRLTVIDVRATVTAAKADRFWCIRPGTDYALNLAIIHVLLAEKRYDQAFANAWIDDLDALTAAVAPYTPQFAEDETGIAAADIVALANDLAQAAPKVVWHTGVMTGRWSDSAAVCRSALVITALLGGLGAKGGLALSAAPETISRKGLKKLTDLFPPVAAPRAGRDGLKNGGQVDGAGLLHLALAAAMAKTDPYPLKALVAFGHDILGDLPDPARLKQLISGLEFMVCVTSTWSETAWWADLVLPLSTHLERCGIVAQREGVTPAFFMRQACTQPRYDTRADWQIVAGLAQRLGLKPLTFKSIEEIWNYQLDGTGVRPADFESRGFVQLTGRPHYAKLGDPGTVPGTASGKIAASLDPYAQRPRPPAGMFWLTVGGCGVHSGGATVNNVLLNRQMPENVLWINDAVASQMGIADGQVVTVANAAARVAIKAKLSADIHPDAVFMVRGFGRNLPVESRAMGKGGADTVLMSGGLEKFDCRGGGLAFQEHFVSVSAAGTDR